MFLSVTVYFGIRTETVMKSLYENAAGEFIGEVKKKGAISLHDYEKFIEIMGVGGTLFDIDFEHRYKVLEPEYRFRTLEEIIDEQNRNYTGPNEYRYREVITERPHVDDPINDGNLNTETNESILEKAQDTPADPNHAHDENCYIGHKHLGEPFFIHTHKHDYTCVEFVSVWYADYTCMDCGIRNHRFVASYYWDETTRSVKIGMYNSGSSSCMNCGSLRVTNYKDIKGYNYSCGYAIDIDGDGYDDPVGYTNTYQYKKPYPPPRTITTKQTYIYGCYKYHEEGYIPVYYYYSGIPFYYNSDLYTLLNNGLNSFCRIPEIFEIEYRWGSGSTEYVTLYFRPSKQPDGTFIVYCSGGSNVNIYESFPAVDVAKFDRLCRDSYQMYIYLRDNITRKTIPGGGSVSPKNLYGTNIICDEANHNTWNTTCGKEEDGTLDCNHIITSLIPTHDTQTVYINDPLISTAIATFKDGSTKTVVCTTSFSTSNIVKDQDVTLTYNYSIDGKNYSNTCNIKVTVIPRNKTCEKGHTYNLNNDGSDPGCPYCKAWIESLQVIRPATTPIIITIGTTLQENGVTLLATYMDGHTEEVTSGYIDNLDKNYLGTMHVTIGYKGASITVTVITVRAKMTCDICGYEYELYPDGTNPGCPRCIQKTPVFTGNIMEYDHINHNEEILKILYDRGVYSFNIDDVFNISIKNKTSNIAGMLLKKIYPSLSDRWFWISKNEYILKR